MKSQFEYIMNATSVPTRPGRPRPASRRTAGSTIVPTAPMHVERGGIDAEDLRRPQLGGVDLVLQFVEDLPGSGSRG